MSLIKHYLQEYYLPKEPTNMEQLEMLTAREQLMIDIDCIVDDFFYEKYNGDIAESDELTRILCDTVSKYFPTN